MRVEFDEAKSQINLNKHGIALDAFKGFDRPPMIRPDDRYDYGEARWQAFGRIDGVAHMIVYTVRDDAVRLISFRRVHEKELQRYE